MPRLTAMWKRHDAFLPADAYRPLARWCSAAGMLDTASYRRVDLCQRLGIDAAVAHDTLADVRICVKLSKTLHERMAARGS